MNIVVCIKQVPATESKIAVARDGADIDRTNLSVVVNPYDEFGVEEALRIRDRVGAGKVVVVTIGPDKAAEALRTALAMGADAAMHLKDPAFDGSDSLATARILAAAIQSVPHDIIFFGKQAIDDDMGAVGIMTACLLGIPHVAVVYKLEVDAAGKRVVAHRQIEGGAEIVETSLPAAFTCQKGLNEPRYASLPGIMKAKQKPLEVKDAAALGIEPGKIGAGTSRTKRTRIEPPPARSAGKVIGGNPSEAVAELVRLLRSEAKVV